MMKPILARPKRLAGLTILVVVIILIGSCCCQDDYSPVISSLTADAEQIAILDSCQIECIASDPDGDELSYTWSANGGNISGEGSTVTWTAPETAGACTITVVVSDGEDGEETKQITIQVFALNNPPLILSLTTDCPRVRKAHTATLTCSASDPDDDDLTFNWSEEAGNISGAGKTVTWVAPNAYGSYLITVTVSDGRGGQASQSIEIIVCGCGSAC